VTRIGAAVCAAVSAWLSLGVLGLVASAGSARVALLPPFWLLGALVVLLYLVVRFVPLSPQQCAPLFGSSVALLPWLPLPVPPAFLIWAGPFVILVWMMVLLGVIDARARPVRSRWLSDIRRAPAVASAAALVLYGASALWLAPILPDGDAPHYLIIAQSLIKDGDLRIENNHQNGDDLEYSLFAAQPDYQQRGRNGAIYSIHAPGLPAIVAPAYFLLGYAGTIAFLALVAALSTGAVWRVAYQVTGNAAAAWFGWASCALTAPFFFQATQVFPDGIAATFVLAGMLPLGLSRERSGLERGGGVTKWLLAGASLAIMPWLQTRLAIIALAVALCVAPRLRSVRQFAAFAALPVVSAAAWFGFFYVIYGTADPSAPYGDNTQTTLANLVRGFPGLLFDQQFGLIPNAPVYAFILIGVVVGALRNDPWSRAVACVAAPYIVGVGMFYIWWGGTSTPARLLAPLALVLGVAAARSWQAAKTPGTRVLGLAALGSSVLMTAVLLGPDRGGLLMNERDGTALWLEWASDLVNLPNGFPTVFRDAPLETWLKCLAWAACAGASWLALRIAKPVDRTPDDPGRFSWQATWCLSLAVMVALTLGWQVDRTSPVTPSTAELALVRGLTPLRPWAFDYGAWRLDRADYVRRQARIRTERSRRPGPANALFFASKVPAGAYQVQAGLSGAAEGMVTLRVGGTPLPMRTESLDQLGVGPSIRLPLAVDSVIVEGDDRARRSVADVELSLVRPSGERLEGTLFPGRARRAIRYDAADAYFEDDLAYPEPSGFWIAGGRRTRIVLANAGRVRELFVRNVPLNNVLAIDIDGVRQELALAPGEERTIQLLPAPGRPDRRMTIRTRTGIRPSRLDPGSADLRFLGCWMEIR
jgi:hypothetical protein